MDPSSYEAIVRQLMGRAAGDTYEAYHLKTYRGKRSGYNHKIDVSLEGMIGGAKLLMLIECKLFTRKVSCSHVMAFAYRLEDIGCHKGVFVSHSGFQKGAFLIAQSVGMALVLCRGRRLDYALASGSRDCEVDHFLRGPKHLRSAEFAVQASDDSCIRFAAFQPLVKYIIHED